MAVGAKRLVIRADDAGSCPESNRAIAACVRAGTVRCVSVMAPCAYLEQAASLLLAGGKGNIGLHVTLNSEWESHKWGPVLPPERVPSLVTPGGHFLPLPADLNARGIVVEEAIAEVAAQLARLRAVRLDPVYLDEHCLVGWISDDLVAALDDFARREGLLPVARRLQGLPGRDGDLVERVRAAPPGDYNAVFHPGEDDPHGLMRRFHLAGQPADGSVARERDAETRLLCRAGLADQLTQAGATLASYSEIFVQ